MTIIQDAAEKLMRAAISHVPDRWLAGGLPDPLRQKHGLIGAPVSRIDGPLKVEGKARFAAEVPFANITYAALAYSSIARGRIATLE